MATTQKIAAPENRIVLSGVSWETYESLLADYANRSAPHFTYDRGVLEVVSPTYPHEKINGALAAVVDMISDELEIDVEDAGSTTFKRHDPLRSFEADSSFYIQHASQFVGKLTIDLSVDPPPDLVIEIDVTNPSLDKLPIYAQMGFPEVWRYDEATGKVAILRLQDDSYRVSERSDVLPPITGTVLTTSVTQSQSAKRTTWLQDFQGWLRGYAPVDRA